MSAPRTFFILALPRSRTAWLSAYLARPTAGCGHDTLTRCADYDAFLRQFVGPNALGGTCETAGMLGWKLLRHRMPEANIILIRRDPQAVKLSLRQQGWAWPEVGPEIDERNEMLDACAKAPGVWSIGYEELCDPAVARRLYETCTGLRWDEDHWQEFARHNIQIDLNTRAHFIAANAARLNKFKTEVLLAASRLGEASCLGLN